MKPSLFWYPRSFGFFVCLFLFLTGGRGGWLCCNWREWQNEWSFKSGENAASEGWYGPSGTQTICWAGRDRISKVAGLLSSEICPFIRASQWLQEGPSCKNTKLTFKCQTSLFRHLERTSGTQLWNTKQKISIMSVLEIFHQNMRFFLKP